MKKTLIIDGHNVTDIPSFYDEINRVFMAGEEWKLGANLDALNDLFHGGYGVIAGVEHVELIWLNMEQSRASLGFETTRNWYQEKLHDPEKFDRNRITKDLAELESGSGLTYFEIVLEIIADHPNIELVPR